MPEVNGPTAGAGAGGSGGPEAAPTPSAGDGNNNPKNAPVPSPDSDSWRNSVFTYAQQMINGGQPEQPEPGGNSGKTMEARLKTMENKNEEQFIRQMEAQAFVTSANSTRETATQIMHSIAESNRNIGEQTRTRLTELQADSAKQAQQSLQELKNAGG
ncbi:hypothetical protein [uncultured Tateyamaria sp.]|uniref:hypothetical protein n=1 Tax=uncultured Tateyamaria sp. TaxID=455651 RepID=UPI002608D317|nr:hypothetical protein [uncultured Tateyamaria sp.]